MNVQLVEKMIGPQLMFVVTKMKVENEWRK